MLLYPFLLHQYAKEIEIAKVNYKLAISGKKNLIEMQIRNADCFTQD